MKPHSKIMFNIFTLSALLVSLLGSAVFVPSVQAELLAAPLYASGDFLWAKGMGGGSDDFGNSVAVDSSGNIYTTGSFQGTVDFNPGTGTANLISAGGNDIFVSKLNSSGDFIWAKNMGGTSSDSSYDISLDSNGNIYIMGSFAGTPDFDPGAGTASLTSAGGSDIFVTKLDSSGGFIWAKNMGGTGFDNPTKFVLDSNANIYTTGYFVDTADFDPGVGTANLSSAGFGTAIFISKLDSSGNYVWAKSIGGAWDARSNSIAVDLSDNVYTIGYFEGTADFDPGVGTFNLTSTGGESDIFVSKLDGSGSFIWAKKMGSTHFDFGYGIVVDSIGNVYTTGLFQDTVDFDPGAGVTDLVSIGFQDTFISKLDSNGDYVWAKSMGGINLDSGVDIALDSYGNVYTMGVFMDTVDFDPGAGTTNLISAGNKDTFLSKLDSHGDYIWAKSIGGTDLDYGTSIALDVSGNIHMAGYFYGTADFDPGAGIANLISAGGSDIFVSKLENDTVAPTVVSFTATSPSTSLNIPITAFTASDAEGVAGYMITTSSTPPAVGDVGWAGTVPAVYTVITDGNYTLYPWAKDAAGNISTVFAPAGVTVDATAPTVSSSLRANPSPSALPSVDFTVSFSESVTGVDTSDFNLTTTGVSGATVSGLSGTGSLYTVSVNTGSGDGTIRLNVLNNGSIKDTALNPLGSAFSSGEVYTISKPATFSDVPLTYWASGYIERLYHAGITGGCGTGIYCPDSTVTRAQMAVFLLKGMHGSSYTPPAVGVSTGFGDVATDYWAAAWIKQLAAEGITGGCGGGNYCPDSTVTRAQMAVFLLKGKNGASFAPPAVGASTGFTDVAADYWAAAFIKQLVADGIISGCGTGVYCPDSNVTRAQMAVFLVKAFNLP